MLSVSNEISFNHLHIILCITTSLNDDCKRLFWIDFRVKIKWNANWVSHPGEFGSSKKRKRKHCFLGELLVKLLRLRFCYVEDIIHPLYGWEEFSMFKLVQCFRLEREIGANIVSILLFKGK